MDFRSRRKARSEFVVTTEPRYGIFLPFWFGYFTFVYSQVQKI